MLIEKTIFELIFHCYTYNVFFSISIMQLCSYRIARELFHVIR